MRAAAREPADRELRDHARGRTADGAAAADRGRRLPGLERRPRRALGARRARRRPGPGLARRARAARRSRASSSRAASPTATTCAAARSPASRRRWTRSPTSPPRAGPVLGICNGFQILCEAGLLPGVLRPNASLAFVCRDVRVRVERTETRVHRRAARPASASSSRSSTARAAGTRTSACSPSSPTSTRSSCATTDENPNGSVGDVAGVCNAEGNVLGLMPHPEHAVDPLLGSGDGALLLGLARRRGARAAALDCRARHPSRRHSSPRPSASASAGCSPSAARSRSRSRARSVTGPRRAMPPVE